MMRWLGRAALFSGLALVAPARAAEERAAPEVVAPAPLAAIEVAYPEGAHGDAEVLLEVVVAEDGTVSRAVVREGQPPFADAALRGVEALRFAPATRNGIPVRARISLRIAFREPAAAAPAAPAPDVAALEEPAIPPPAPAPPEPVEVVVLGEERAELGAIHVPREEARRVPGAFADPFRVVEVLPGVAPVLSGLPYFYVRGAPPGSVGYFIDGVRVPLLFHVGPGPSVIAPALVDRVDLFAGAYPARHGRFAGAILSGTTLPPGARARAEGQARIFDASAMFEQPFAGGRGSVLAGGRYSYTQAILAAVAPDYELGYGDYQARLAYAVTPEDRLTAFAFGGYDLLRNRERRLTLFDVVFHRLDLRWDRAWADGKLRLATTLASDRVLSSPEDDGAPGTSLESRGIGARLELEQRFHARARLRSGLDFSADRVEGDREQLGELEARVFPTRTDLTSGAYADVVWSPIRAVDVVPGVRVDVQRSRGETHAFVEPRLSTRTRIARGVAHLAGFGIAHQLPASTVRMPGRRPNVLELSQQEAIQASQGVEYALPDGMLGRTTLFHQFVDVDTEGVHGRSYGVEQFLRRDFTQRLGGFLSYTLSRAEGSIGREDVLSSYDRTHVVSAVLGADLGAGFRLGGRAYYASGRAFALRCPTPDCGPGDPGAPFDFTYRFRLPDFFRLDVRFEKQFRFASGFWLTTTFEWFNALLAREVDEAFWTPDGIAHDEPSPLTLPSIGVELGY